MIFKDAPWKPTSPLKPISWFRKVRFWITSREFQNALHVLLCIGLVYAGYYMGIRQLEYQTETVELACDVAVTFRREIDIVTGLKKTTAYCLHE